MSDTKFPIALYHPAAEDPEARERFIQMTLKNLANKTIMARNQDELEALLKIGWKPR